MNKKWAAVASAVVSIGIALAVGVPFASAQESGGGGQCNNYGNNNIIVAPFCGATLPVPTSQPVPTRTLPTVPTYTFPPINPVPTTTSPVACPQIFPPLPGCPGYPPFLGGGTIGGVPAQ
ncbi:hypothetical protein GCM10027511_14270 [Hymenobacter humi]